MVGDEPSSVLKPLTVIADGKLACVFIRTVGPIGDLEKAAVGLEGRPAPVAGPPRAC
jgi:hypothetical protein